MPRHAGQSSFRSSDFGEPLPSHAVQVVVLELPTSSTCGQHDSASASVFHTRSQPTHRHAMWFLLWLGVHGKCHSDAICQNPLSISDRQRGMINQLDESAVRRVLGGANVPVFRLCEV